VSSDLGYTWRQQEQLRLHMLQEHRALGCAPTRPTQTFKQWDYRDSEAAVTGFYTRASTVHNTFHVLLLLHQGVVATGAATEALCGSCLLVLQAAAACLLLTLTTCMRWNQ
jgi:hypothetical protein